MNLMNNTVRLFRYGFRPSRFPLAMALLDDGAFAGLTVRAGKVGNVVCSVAGGFVDLARYQAATHLGINHGAL